MTFQVSICSVKAQKHPVIEFVIIVIIIIPPSILLHCEHAAQSIQLCTLGDWHLLLQITCKTYRKYVIRLLSKAVFCFANISTNAAYWKRNICHFWTATSFCIYIEVVWTCKNVFSLFTKKWLTCQCMYLNKKGACILLSHFCCCYCVNQLKKIIGVNKTWIRSIPVSN